MSQSMKWAAMCAAGMAMAGLGLTSSSAKADQPLVVKPAVVQTTGQSVSVPVQEVGWRYGGGGYYRGGPRVGVYGPGGGVYVGRPYYAPRYYGGYYGGYGYRPYGYNYGYSTGYAPAYGYSYPAYGYSYPAYGYGYTW
jgi:hypothetical protein